MNRLSVYWSVMHRRPADYDFFRRLQPTVFKLMDAGPPDYAWARQNLPNSLVIARDHALSEQHDDMRRDPNGTGIRHAQEWHRHAARLGFDRKNTLVLGINEPRVWESGVPEALRQYTIALCSEATDLGLRVGAMQLGVGWPGNNGPNTPPDWTPFHGVEAAIKRNNGALVTHEYFADRGPGENWGWWCGRTLKCPWNVPIVIGEAGIDMFVKSAQFGGSRGWNGQVDAARYARELAEYVGRMSVDSRFVGACVFASDFANREWFSFDIEPAYQAILNTPVIIPPQPPAPVTGSGYTQTQLNVRSGPGIEYPVLETLPLGSPVSWTATAGVWLNIAPGRWVSGDYVAPAEPGPVVVQPPSSGSDWERAIAFVLKMEGGFQNHVADTGNYYQGKLIGTKYGISAASWGGQYDIPTLTVEQARSIYFEHYWKASGADKQPWPLSLLILDTAVLHGVGTAQTWLREVGPNPYLFAAKRLRAYTVFANWPSFGIGWARRVSSLLEEIGR